MTRKSQGLNLVSLMLLALMSQASVLPLRAYPGDTATYHAGHPNFTIDRNIANAKMATTSSEAPQWDAGAVRDIGRGTRWAKDGKYAFHTQNEPSPWWKVELGDYYPPASDMSDPGYDSSDHNFPLGYVVIYNRTDCCSERADGLSVEIRRDLPNGKSKWSTVYTHVPNTGGPSTNPHIGGRHDDGPDTPLVLRLAAGTKGRAVRIHLNSTNYLHLDGVEVYPPDPE